MLGLLKERLAEADCNGNAFLKDGGEMVFVIMEIILMRVMLFVGCPEFGLMEEIIAGSLTQDLSNLAAGTYTVVATDEMVVQLLQMRSRRLKKWLLQRYSDYTGYGVRM